MRSCSLSKYDFFVSVQNKGVRSDCGRFGGHSNGFVSGLFCYGYVSIHSVGVIRRFGCNTHFGEVRRFFVLNGQSGDPLRRSALGDLELVTTRARRKHLPWPILPAADRLKLGRYVRSPKACQWIGDAWGYETQEHRQECLCHTVHRPSLLVSADAVWSRPEAPGIAASAASSV